MTAHTLSIYTNRYLNGAPEPSTLTLTEPPEAAPYCDWCARRRANIAVDDVPYCSRCLAELTKRARTG